VAAYEPEERASEGKNDYACYHDTGDSTTRKRNTVVRGGRCGRRGGTGFFRDGFARLKHDVRAVDRVELGLE
jgi:hypothetical protein